MARGRFRRRTTARASNRPLATAPPSHPADQRHVDRGLGPSAASGDRTSRGPTRRSRRLRRAIPLINAAWTGWLGAASWRQTTARPNARDSTTERSHSPTPREPDDSRPASHAATEHRGPRTAAPDGFARAVPLTNTWLGGPRAGDRPSHDPTLATAPPGHPPLTNTTWAGVARADAASCDRPPHNPRPAARGRLRRAIRLTDAAWAGWLGHAHPATEHHAAPPAARDGSAEPSRSPNAAWARGPMRTAARGRRCRAGFPPGSSRAWAAAAGLRPPVASLSWGTDRTGCAEGGCPQPPRLSTGPP